MKRVLISATVILAGVGLLTGCSTSEPSSASGLKAATDSPKLSGLYQASGADSNYISHWIFKQKLPDGSTVTCVAAEDSESSSLSISCLPNTKTAATK